MNLLGEADDLALFKYIKIAQLKNYISPHGLISHAIDTINVSGIQISDRNPKLLKKAEKILEKSEQKMNIIQNQKDIQRTQSSQNQIRHIKNLIIPINKQDQLENKSINAKQLCIGQSKFKSQIIKKRRNKSCVKNETKDMVKTQQSDGNKQFINKNNSICQDIHNLDDQGDKQNVDNTDQSQSQNSKDFFFCQNETKQYTFQELQNQKLQEYKQLDEKKKLCDVDRKKMKKQKVKWQKILHHYQMQIVNMENVLQNLVTTYPFLNQNVGQNEELQQINANQSSQIEKKVSISNNIFESQLLNYTNNLFPIKKEEECHQKTFNNEINIQSNINQKYRSMELQNINCKLSPSRQQSIQYEQDINIKMEYISQQNLNQPQTLVQNSLQNNVNQEQIINNNQIKKEVDFEQYQKTKIEKIEGETKPEDNQEFENYLDLAKPIEDIISGLQKKKLKFKGNVHFLEQVDTQDLIEKTFEESKELYSNSKYHSKLILYRLKRVKKFLIEKQNEAMNELDELFKVNFWPKKYKYTREKGSKEKQEQIEDEIENNKQLQLQSKQLLLDLSKKKFEVKTNDYQSKRSIHKLENYLIKRHQDERKLSKKLQLHNQMKNFIMYSIRYVADNIQHDDPLDIERQKKILSSFHLTYNKSDLQALVSPYEPYTLENITQVLNYSDDKQSFKASLPFVYQKQMINQYNPDLFKELQKQTKDKIVTIENLSWEDLIQFPDILDLFNQEIERLKRFNRQNRIFMQYFCLYEYPKIIFKGKGNKIDHLYGNNFILSALRVPEVIQL